MSKKTRTAEPGKAQHGHNRTLKDAALAVLEAAGEPLSIPEITAGIISRRLYRFNTASPSTVVSHAVRRNCKGLDIPRHTGREDFTVETVDGVNLYTAGK